MAWSGDLTSTDYDHYSDYGGANPLNYASDNNPLNNLQQFSYVAIDFGAGNAKTIARMRVYTFNAAIYTNFIVDGDETFEGSNNSTDGSDGDWTELINFQDEAPWAPAGYPDWGQYLTVASPASYRWYRVANLRYNTNSILGEWEMEEELGGFSNIASVNGVSGANVTSMDSVDVSTVTSINGVTI